jgi:hypothetical protein
MSRSIPSAAFGACAVLLSFLAAAAALADCSPPGGVHLNEIRFIDAEAPIGDRLNALVEIHNKDVSTAVLDGWTITDENAAVMFTFPSLSLPPGAFLLVHFATGADDLDFSDGVGHVYAGGDSVGVFGHQSGAAALYDDDPGAGTIRDYVSWSPGANGVSGDAGTDAGNAGIWPAASSVPVDPVGRYYTLRLLPDGYDNDSPVDWFHYGWAESRYSLRVPGPNPVQESPGDGMGFNPGPVTLTWTDVRYATGYRLVVSTDSTLTGGTVIDVTTAATDTTLNLPDGAYYWRVSPVDSCGEVPGGAIWLFLVFPVSLEPGVLPAGEASAFGVLNVQRFLQHRDTSLLCLWDDANRTRPGCSETAGPAGPWDGPHPANHAEVVFQGDFYGFEYNFRVQCPHCRNYCGRACVQMINSFYGGTLSQDRISYHMMTFERAAGRVVAAPEGDLGHDLPVLLNPTITQTLQWSLPNSTVTVPLVPSYGLIKAEIQAGFPVYAFVPGHVVVINGFLDANHFAAGFPPRDVIVIQDPWPGPANQTGFNTYATANIRAFWRIRQAGAAAIAGRMQEASVTTDTDGDGVMDFDEGYPTYPANRPRRLQSDNSQPDTDKDEVRDKQDIRSYTFHDSDHPGHENDPLGFPDVDGDGLRAELDCDTDADVDFDGGEDIDGNGASPGAGETCVYTVGDSDFVLETDQVVYTTSDHVILSGHTLHGNSSYNYYVYDACPLPLTPEEAYAGWVASGTVTTTANGHIVAQDIGTYASGCYEGALDILQDGLFGWETNPPGVLQICDETFIFAVEEDPVPVETSTLRAHAAGGGRTHLEWTLAPGGNPGRARVERAGPSGASREIGVVDPAADREGKGFFVDASLEAAGNYRYRVAIEAPGGEITLLGPVDVLVTAPPLGVRGAVNPFVERTTVVLSLPRAGGARVDVFGPDGRLVRRLSDGRRGMGASSVDWDGRDGAGRAVPAGVYYVRVQTAEGGATAKLVRVR